MTVVINTRVFSSLQLDLIKDFFNSSNIEYEYFDSSKVYSKGKHILLTKGIACQKNTCGNLPYISFEAINEDACLKDNTYYLKNRHTMKTQYRLDASKEAQPILLEILKCFLKQRPYYQVLYLIDFDKI